MRPIFFVNYISINDKYCLLEDKKKIEIDYNFEKKNIIPFCFGGLINTEYIFIVEINYKKHRSKSILSLPIDIYTYDDESISIDERDIINNIINNGENKNNNYIMNINSSDENNLKKNMDEYDGFVVYEKDDFKKALVKGKNK